MFRNRERVELDPSPVVESVILRPPSEAVLALEGILPEESTFDVVERSVDMNLHILLRNMRGAAPELGDVIRNQADEAFWDRRPMEVLEAGDSVPLKALYFQGGLLRRDGDYMLHGPHGSHDAPRVCSTTVASRDYVEAVLTDDEAFVDDPEWGVRRYVADFLNGAMEFPTGVGVTSAAGRMAIKQAYDRRRGDYGAITAITNDSPVAALQDLYRAGKRYDLLFPDVPAVADRLNYLQAIQACLRPKGRAFVPVEWWRPGGPDEPAMINLTLMSDKVTAPEGAVPLEDYLSSNFPTAFQVANYPGVKTLVVSGTKQPVQLTDFAPAVIAADSADAGLSINWTPIKL